MAVTAGSRGRASKTSYAVLQEMGGAALVECTLHTGRTHQIRVHMKHIGHPVLGDKIYGGGGGGFGRQMLHAWKLGFFHPKSGEWLQFQSPIPADFVEAGVRADLQ
jgi:23S rRNA pseudouridine1911/1915/1917 synthase